MKMDEYFRNGQVLCIFGVCKGEGQGTLHIMAENIPLKFLGVDIEK